MSQVLKFRDNPGQLSSRDTAGTIAIFPGRSRPNRDGWQLCASHACVNAVLHLQALFHLVPSLCKHHLILFLYFASIIPSCSFTFASIFPSCSFTFASVIPTLFSFFIKTFLLNLFLCFFDHYMYKFELISCILAMLAFISFL